MYKRKNNINTKMSQTQANQILVYNLSIEVYNVSMLEKPIIVLQEMKIQHIRNHDNANMSFCSNHLEKIKNK